MSGDYWRERNAKVSLVLKGEDLLINNETVLNVREGKYKHR